MGKPTSLKYRLAALLVFLLALAGIALYQTSTSSPADDPEQPLPVPAQEEPGNPAIEETARLPRPFQDPALDRTAKRKPAAVPKSLIHGTVRDSDGEAIGRVHLRWIPLGQQALSSVSHDALLGPEPHIAPTLDEGLREAVARSVTVRSDPRGSYEMRIPKGDATGSIVASSTGYERVIREIEAVAQRETLQVDFYLAPSGAISGKVTESASGTPATGMRVSAQRLEPAHGQGETIGPLAPSALVANDGRYSIEGLPPGSYRVAPRTGSSKYAHVSYEESKNVALRGGTEALDVDFKVTVGGVIRARVTDLKRRPLRAQCLVILPRSDGGERMRRGRTTGF